MSDHNAPILYLPHGGGPLPLLGDPGHQGMKDFLEAIPGRLGQPEAIVVISAHWETETVTVTTGAQPELIYDYYGFPEESYRITYPAPGHPALANDILQCLADAGIPAQGDDQRGFDHGLFIPLKMMYPQANVPCVQVSLLHSLDARAHLAIGEALAPLRGRNLLVVGSGLSFHNMKLLMGGDSSHDQDIDAFHDWLRDSLTDPAIDRGTQALRLENWEQAPGARLCHPREEHLLPLHVCWGMAAASSHADVVFDGPVMGRRAMGLLW
ncbi:MAG: class III extradiol ring-cleavage dioxygenase [Marinobacter sp.]|nr:class III extradiol ring-cleavage dioxygenase [Marinobacter sp.]